MLTEREHNEVLYRRALYLAITSGGAGDGPGVEQMHRDIAAYMVERITLEDAGKVRKAMGLAPCHTPHGVDNVLPLKQLIDGAPLAGAWFIALGLSLDIGPEEMDNVRLRRLEDAARSSGIDIDTIRRTILQPSKRKGKP